MSRDGLPVMVPGIPTFGAILLVYAACIATGHMSYQRSASSSNTPATPSYG
ncbi:hypothetical protein B0H13DRAFT_2310854 [Mycena leptocephala]|nr:hypothetical protein B0H13DRAFT_2310854 [Mycena leptocephala]